MAGLVLLVVILLLAVLGLAANLFGVDSRESSSDPHRPSSPF